MLSFMGPSPPTSRGLPTLVAPAKHWALGYLGRDDDHLSPPGGDSSNCSPRRSRRPFPPTHNQVRELYPGALLSSPSPHPPAMSRGGERGGYTPLSPHGPVPLHSHSDGKKTGLDT